MDELREYIRNNIARGVRAEAITHALKQAGYTDPEIRTAFLPPRQFLNAMRNYTTHARQRLQPWMAKIKKPFAAPKPNRTWMPTKKILPYILLAALMTLIIMLMLISKQNPPVVSFIDNTTGSFASGSVYYDSTYLGDTKGTFNKLPKDFCEKDGVLQIVTNRGPFAFTTDKSDCKTRRLSFVVNIIQVKEVGFYLTMEFMTESRNPLSGALFIDNKAKGTIEGTYDIYKGECRLARIINLTNISNKGIQQGYMEWINEPELCENDIIRYKAKTYIKEEVPLPQIDDVQTVLAAIQQATKECMTYCPNAANCTTEQKIMFCASYIKNIDLNGNGELNDYITPVLDSYGVCESNLYCSQIVACNCEKPLTFDACTSLICLEYQRQNITEQRATEMLRNQFSEGDCTNDNEYDQSNSWLTHYINEGRLSCAAHQE
ncbi:MAG: hypothetical protein ABIF10_00550 [Candidatus Woesearchaeota archaeon]